MNRARRPLLAGVSALLLFVSVLVGVSPSSGADGDQITLFKGTYTQTKTSYGNPNPITGNQPADFTKPKNYAQGHLYYRLEILEKPSNKSIYAQLCFWRHEGSQKFKYETCTRTGRSQYHFSKKGVYYVDAGRPVDFWKKNNNYDWSKQASVTRFMLFDAASRKLLIERPCGKACYPGNDLDKHVPIKFKAEVIFVAKGKQLRTPAGWSCPSAWNCLPAGGGGGGTTTTTARTTTTAQGTTTIGNNGGSTFPGTPPYGPTLTLKSGTRSFQASWPAVSGAKLYQLKYRKSGTAKWTWNPVGESRSISRSGLTNGAKYQVHVRAYANKQWRSWTKGTVTPG